MQQSTEHGVLSWMKVYDKTDTSSMPKLPFPTLTSVSLLYTSHMLV